MISRKWLVVIAGCFVVTALLTTVKVMQIREAIAFGKSFPESMEAVELAIVEEGPWQPSVNVTGKVLAVQKVDLTNELGGQIVEIGFKPGDIVEQGQVLIRLDTSEERAQLAAAEADAELARLALDRNQKLAKSGVASQEERDIARAQANAAAASEDRLKAIIEKKTIRAPFRGKAGIYDLEVGQFIQANTELTRVVGINDEVWIDFNLPQQKASLREGDEVEISAPLLFDGTYIATIIARDSWVNPNSGNLLYRASLPKVSDIVYPGSVVNIKVMVGEERIVNRVPITSVRYDAIGPNVYVLVPAEEGADGPERAQKRNVVLGPEEDSKVVILDGLKAGERVAGNGAFKLRDGILVKAIVVEPPVDDKPKESFANPIEGAPEPEASVTTVESASVSVNDLQSEESLGVQ